MNGQALVEYLLDGGVVQLMDEPFGALDALTRTKLQDELLSDKIVMLTNGPAATIGEVLSVDLPRPRSRVDLADNLQYLGYRKAVIDFLYTRQGHVEKAA